jgi:hypothetical protein
MKINVRDEPGGLVGAWSPSMMRSRPVSRSPGASDARSGRAVRPSPRSAAVAPRRERGDPRSAAPCSGRRPGRRRRSCGARRRRQGSRLPEQVRRLRARHQVMDGRRVAGAAVALDLAHVAVVGEHGLAEPLPSRHRVAAVAHSSKIAAPSSRLTSVATSPPFLTLGTSIQPCASSTMRATAPQPLALLGRGFGSDADA